MNSATCGGTEVTDLRSASSVIPRWQDVGSNIVGGRYDLACLHVYLLICLFDLVHCVCVCVCVCVCLQGKYEFRNFINTKTTKREAQTANVLKALGDKEYKVRYSEKTRAAPLPVFRARRYEDTSYTPYVHSPLLLTHTTQVRPEVSRF